MNGLCGGCGRNLLQERLACLQAYFIEFKREDIHLAKEEGMIGIKLKEKIKTMLHYNVSTSTLIVILEGESNRIKARSRESC